MKPKILYHCTTEKRAKHYYESRRIISPVRGFTTIEAALAWCVKTGRTVIYEIQAPNELTHKLPDHHNKFGYAWWIDSDVSISDITCVFSASKDA